MTMSEPSQQNTNPLANEPSSELTFYLDEPPRIFLKAGGSWGNKYWFKLYHQDSLDFETVLAMVDLKAGNGAENAFTMASALIAEWNFTNKDGTVAAITPEAVKRLPIVALGPVLAHMASIKDSFLDLESLIVNLARSQS